MTVSRRVLFVLYGSETGTAENYARLIGSEARRYRFSSQVASMEEFSLATLVDFSENELIPVCFVCSTTGLGEDPENMRIFWRHLLKRSLPSDLLQNVTFAVLAFGDSSYAKFNFAGKKLFRRLLQLGARSFHEIGLCDDQHEFGPEAVAGLWIEEMFAKLITQFPLENGENVIPSNVLLPSTLDARFLDSQVTSENVKNGNFNKNPQSQGFETTLLSNERVTAPQHWQDTRLLSFQMRDSVSYGPGDVAVLYPQNLMESQDLFLEIFELDRNSVVELSCTLDSGQNLPNRLPKLCSLDYLVSSYFDLQCTPGVNFFKTFHKLASDELEREKLEEFCSKEGQDDFIDYCVRPKRTILEVFQDFPKTTSQIPFSYFFDILTPIKPRSFSIASNFGKHGNVLQLLVAVVSYKTRLVKERLGLCSNWLARLGENCKVFVNIRRGSMKLPGLNVPCIFVGPGTGVAPVRNMILERTTSKQSEFESEISQKCGNFLFFGFRSKKSDFYFEREWSELATENVLKLFVAPSRDFKEKRYVQHLVRENSVLVSDLILEHSAFVFICGSAKEMPTEVKNAISECLSLKIGEESSKDFVASMEKTVKLQLETWS